MPTQTSNRSIHKWLLPAIIAIGAGGMGVTGTLLWMENQPRSTSASTTKPSPNSAMGASTPGAGGNVKLPSAFPSADPNAGIPAGASASTPHEPPATLTAGMPPVQAALALGNWYYDHEAWPQAVEQYQKTIAQGLDNPDVRTDLGSALRFGGEPQKALEQYLLAQKQNPRHENSLFNQGGLYASDLKQPARAIAAWQEYIKRFPAGQSVSQARQLIGREKKQLKN